LIQRDEKLFFVVHKLNFNFLNNSPTWQAKVSLGDRIFIEGGEKRA